MKTNKEIYEFVFSQGLDVGADVGNVGKAGRTPNPHRKYGYFALIPVTGNTGSQIPLINLTASPTESKMR